MAQSVTTPNGTLIVPGGVGTARVISSPSGFGTQGVVAIIGESSKGPSLYEEISLAKNAFGPDQDAAIRAKYGTGPLVDAALGIADASADEEIVGSVSRMILVKTNRAAAAAGTLPAGSGTWATVAARDAGKDGNLVSVRVESAQAEVVPTTGSILLAPPQQSTVFSARANGAAPVTATLTTGELPSAMVSAIDALSGVAATGGASRSVITAVAGTLSMTLDSGFQCHIVISTAWANVPTVGDLLYIPTGSPLAAANEGSYVVTAATTTRIDAYKLLDAVGAGAARTAPITEGPFAVAATTDVQAFSPVAIAVEAGAIVSGLGKSLEVANSGSTLLSDVSFKFASATTSPPAAAYAGISKTGVPVVLASAAEYRARVTASRQSDSVSDSATTGGDVAMTLGYTGTTASAVIASGVMTITVVGGSGASQTVTLADYATIADLCSYLSTLAGYSAAPGTAALGQLSPTRLDPGTYGCATTMGAKTGRIKDDGATAAEDLAALSLVSIAAVSPATALVGLPAVSAQAFLAGGTRGSTSNADVLAALAALEKVRCNFVVAYFDQDATADIAAGLTDSASTYDITSVAANLKSHCITMTGFKRRRNRQGFVGFNPSTFSAAQEFSANLASAPIAVSFQPCRATDSTGTVRTFTAKMLAAKCAGMQAAAGYRPIVDKFINVSGVLPVTGFDDQSDTDLENAITAGLLIATADEAGGFRWVIDQTTYVKDSNFVWNSVGNQYNLNVLLLGFIQRMQRVANGRSVADFGAAQGLTAAERYLNDAFAAKLIASSDELPKGWGKLRVRLEAPAMYFDARVVLSTGILFEIIGLEVVPATQTAG